MKGDFQKLVEVSKALNSACRSSLELLQEIEDLCKPHLGPVGDLARDIQTAIFLGQLKMKGAINEI